MLATSRPSESILSYGSASRRPLAKPTSAISWSAIGRGEVQRGRGSSATARPGEIRHSLADIQRARKLLGYRPIVDFKAGLHPTIDWNRRETAHSVPLAARG